MVDFQELFVYDEDDTATGSRERRGRRCRPAGGRPARPRTGAAGRGGAGTAVPAAVPGRLPGSVRRVRGAARGRPGHAARRTDRPPVGGPSQVTAEMAGGLAPDDRRRQAGRLRPRRRSNRGCPEAEDVAQQHAPPPFAVEGRPRPLVTCATPRAARSTCRTARAPSAASTARVPTVVRSSDARPTPRRTRPRTVDDRLDALREQLGGPVLTAELLDRALTHRSFAYENGGLPTNERLEFLGDSVLGVVVTETLFRTHPDLPEGQLAKLRAAVVNARALAEVARTIGLGEHIMLGRGEESTGGRDKSSILSDTVEAVIGAVYLSGGFEDAARRDPPAVRPADGGRRRPRRRPGLEDQPAGAVRGHALGVPEYLIEDEGPDHEKTFTAQVRVGERMLRPRRRPVARRRPSSRPPRPPTARLVATRRRPHRQTPRLPRPSSARAPRGRGRPARPRGARRSAAPSPRSRCCTPGRSAGTWRAPTTSPPG